MQHYAAKNVVCWFFYVSASWDCACEPIQSKLFCLEEFSSLEEEENAQLYHKYRQLQDENWTHVEQMKSTDKRKKCLII